VLLFEEKYIGVARVGHPALQSDTISLDDFCQHPHLLVAPYKGDAFGPTDKALSTIGRSRKIGLVVPGFSVCGALLEQSDLISVLPERLLSTMRRNLTGFKLPVDVETFRVEMVWPERLKKSISHIWLRDKLKEAVKDIAVPQKN
jgi:DNA-binding transcriptional LysR family regulator